MTHLKRFLALHIFVPKLIGSVLHVVLPLRFTGRDKSNRAHILLDKWTVFNANILKVARFVIEKKLAIPYTVQELVDEERKSLFAHNIERYVIPCVVQ